MVDSLFQQWMLPACVLLADGSVLAWNSAMSDLTAIDPAAALGQPFGGSATLGQVLRPILEQAAEADTASITWQERLFQLHWKKLPDATYLLVLHDQQGFADRDREKNKMLRAISHDLKAPISAMRGYLELVAAWGPLNEKQTHFANRAKLALQEMAELVDRLLDIAWIEAGIKLVMQPFDLAELILHITERYSEWARAQGIEIRCVFAEHLPKILGDERRLQQVISNLLSNAIKYSPQGGRVEIDLQRSAPGEVQFSIRDQGMGIPAEHLPHIFEQFFRVPHASSHSIEGTGLGLYISYDIVAKHGHLLQVESAIGQGSRFFFNLATAP
jgi:two-component system sensor histidine kinase VicK